MNHCLYTVSDTLHACARFQLREYNYWFSRRFVQDLFSRCIAFFRRLHASRNLSLSLSTPQKKEKKKKRGKWCLINPMKRGNKGVPRVGIKNLKKGRRNL